jgi:hypothetical protein
VENSLWVDGPEGGVCSHPRGRDGDAERRGGIEDPRGMRSKSGGDSSGCTCWADGITKKKVHAAGGGFRMLGKSVHAEKEGKSEAVSFGRRRKGRCHRDEGDMKCRQRRGGRGKALEESGFGGVESV